MPRTSRTGSPRGFTLLEVILAMALGGLLMAAIFGVFTGVISAERRVQAQNDRIQSARFLLSRLESDLLNASPGSENQANFSAAVTEPLRIRTRTELGMGSVEYVFKDKALVRTWTPDPVSAPVEPTTVKGEEEPAALSGVLKMEIARDLDVWSWKPKASEDAAASSSSYPQGLQIQFKWPAVAGVPPLTFERLFRLEAQPLGEQK